MIKNFTATIKFVLLSSLVIFSLSLSAQSVLIDHNFQVTTLPAGVTSNGAISPTKAADGVCSQGMIQINTGQFLQVDIPSCSVFRLHMKSTSSSARLVTVKYKLDGQSTYTTLTTNLSVQTAAAFNLQTLFPVLISSIPVTVLIETAGNIQVHDLYVMSNGSQSAEAEVTAFKLNGQIGNETINSSAGTIAINVPLGTSLTSVIPQAVSISSQASINPPATSAQNFTAPVVYTVTAQNGATKNWTVTVTQVASPAKEITAFVLSSSQIGNATINSAAGTIGITMPNTVNLTNISPSSITISANATIAPSATAAQNFTSPVTYTVTAQDGSTKSWTVNVTSIDPSAVFFDYQAEAATFTGTVDNNHTGFTGSGFINFVAGGENEIVFTICQVQAGSRTVKFRYSLANDEDRKGKLFVNDVYIQTLAFPRTNLFTDWAEEIASVGLQTGINNIKLTWDTTDGPNLDKMMLTGQACNEFTLSSSATNGGTVTLTPARNNNRYFEGELVTALAAGTPSIIFNNWSGDLTGNTNPSTITINANKTIVANFSVVPTYRLNVAVTGMGQVNLNPPGGEYAANTVVTLTPQSVLGSTFTGWSGDLSGNVTPGSITMTGIMNVTANFTSPYSFNFDNVKGFAASPGDGFNVPTTGGQCSPDTVFINGPAQFNQLCESLYYRQQAYKNNVTTMGMKKAPLVIVLKAGVYDGTQTLSTNGAKVFGNYMMDIPEQGDLTVVGESNVVFKIGINVKRAWNILIRNITFYDYQDDGINIGYPQTHHIWIDHCTFGHPTTMPADQNHPDGGCDVKDGASYVTISWCLFRNSWKTSLIGHSDNNGATDIGRLKVTMINNHFYNTNSRNPRVRFGEVHVVNNLSEQVKLYGIAAANSAKVFAENNFYLNTDWPMYADRTVADFKLVYGNNSDNTYTSKTGNYPALGLKQAGNEYDDSGLPVITAQLNAAMKNPGGRSVKFDELNPTSVFDPHTYYSYTPLTAQEVKVVVPLYAGADKVNFSTANCSTMPLQLLSFDAVQVETPTKLVKVSWITTNEVNTLRFDIEKSSDGRIFKRIASQQARNLAGEHHYSFIDNDPLAGVSFYRLKQLDTDGVATYSRIAVINNRSAVQLSAYPNPAANFVAVSHPKAIVGASLRVLDAVGRNLITTEVSAGVNITNMNISALNPGNYFIVYENGPNRLVTKLVKL
jgi:pectate lyase